MPDRRAGARPTETRSALESRPGRARRHLGHPHPQRRRAGGRQLHRRGAGRARATCRPPSTATASAAATPTWSASGQPGAQDGAAAAAARWRRPDRPDDAVAQRGRDRQRRAQRLPAVRRAVSAFAHKGGVHGAAVAKVERSYQHVDPTLVGNEGRLVVSELGGRANTRIRAEQLGHRLDGVVDPRSCRSSSRSWRPTASPSRVPRRPSSCSSGAARPGYAAPFRIAGLHRAGRSSARAASCSPRRPSR